MDTTRRLPGLPPVVLLALYVFVALLPLGIAYVRGGSPRPFRDDLSSALAMSGFAMLLMEFVISGRFRAVSGRIGIDLSMRFHQLVARTLTVFLLVHPWLYTLPTGRGRMGEVGSAASLGLVGAPAVTGWLARFLLLALVVWAMFRRDIGYRYETWRLAHGIGALALALTGLHHAIGAGRYSADPVLAAVWYVLVAVAVLSMAHVYLLKPMIKRRHPYHVVSVERLALKTWQVTLQAVRGEAMAFQAGQFAWLSVNRSPFSITEHPFSMSSCPADRPRVAFTIKEAGDFTSTIGQVPVGATAYLDGPHGNLVVGGHAASGLALIAGGVGLAPLMSILRQARAESDRRPIRLVYGNRLEDQVMYREELEEMRSTLDLQVFHVLSEPPVGWTGKTGQLDQPMLAECLGVTDPPRWLYLVCGTMPMIDSVEDSLSRLGIPARRILSERFSYD